jgi:hypothetical protein
MHRTPPDHRTCILLLEKSPTTRVNNFAATTLAHVKLVHGNSTSWAAFRGWMGAITNTAATAHGVHIVHNIIHIVPGARFWWFAASQRQRDKRLQPPTMSCQIEDAAAVLHIDGILNQS